MACRCCDWCCASELGSVCVFLLLVGVVHVLGRVMRLVSVLRLPARKTLATCWWERVRCAFGVLLWATLEVVCVGEDGGVSCSMVSFLFARGDGGGVVMCLFLVRFCCVSIGCALSGMM